MKLSVWSAYYIDLSPEDALRELKKHGYDYCELSDEHALALLERGNAKEIGKKFGEFAKEIGIELSQGHLFLKANICDSEDRDLLKRQFDLFGAIGIKNAVLHCDNLLRMGDNISVEYKKEQNLLALKDLLGYIKGTDLVICLENICNSHFIHKAEDLLYFIDNLKSENLGICLDTGHLNLTANPNQAEFIEKAGKHIKALHIADNEGLGFDQHMMPFGKGTVDIISVVKAMKALNYDGLYNLEIPGERLAPLEIRGYKLEYIKKMFSYLDEITK